MSDVISRKAAIDAIFSEALYEPGMKKRDTDAVVLAIFEKIKSLPSASQRTGRWIPLQLSIAYPPYQCSCCFGNAPMVMVGTGRLKKGHLEALLTDFCPHCGADMRGGQDE